MGREFDSHDFEFSECPTGGGGAIHVTMTISGEWMTSRELPKDRNGCIRNLWKWQTFWRMAVGTRDHVVKEKGCLYGNHPWPNELFFDYIFYFICLLFVFKRHPAILRHTGTHKS